MQDGLLLMKNKENEADSHITSITLIHIQSEVHVNISQVSKNFERQPLRLDSYVFVFFETEKGE